MIQTGLLWIPALDDATDESIRALLAQDAQLLIVKEFSAGHQRAVIEEVLRRWSDLDELDCILSIGGTLPAPGPEERECVPEATLAVVERALPGLPESMRLIAGEVNPLSALDRSVAGIRGRTLILNLPAGAESAALFLEAVLHLIEPIHRHLTDAPSAVTLDDGFAAPEAGGSERGLDEDEFRAFLARRHTDSDA